MDKKVLKVMLQSGALLAGYEIGVACANEYGACLPRTFDEITPSNAWFPATLLGVGALMIGISLIDTDSDS